ncbi:hypothetical protein PMAYCL1PPCAC_21146, partial [Pristionchus mayeri]
GQVPSANTTSYLEMSSFKAEDIPGLIQSVLTMAKGDHREMAKKYEALWGESLDKSLDVLGIRGNLNALAQMRPDLFYLQYGKLASAVSGDQTDVVDQMNRSNAPKNKKGSRGGGSFRGGRAGSNAARGGGFGNYGAAFRSEAPRGGGGGGGSRGGYRGGGRGGPPSQPSYSGGGGRGGSGYDSGFGSRGNDSYGGDSRKRDYSPPRDNYSNRDSYSRNEPPRTGNRGFASDYDDFAESSRRGGYEDDRRDDRSYDNRRTDNRGYDYDYEYDETTIRADDYEYENEQRGGRDDRYNGQSFKVTVRNDTDRDYDRRVDYSNDRRDGYRNPEPEYGDEDDYGRNRRRDERDDYGRGQSSDRGFGRDSFDNHQDDRTQRDYQREEVLPARKAFPSAFGAAASSSTRMVTNSSIFAPQAYNENDRRSPPSAFARPARNEPEDPVQQPAARFEKEPCKPYNSFDSLPPGLEQTIRTGPPPGLSYPVGPPPGLPNLPPCDPAKKTPTQREQEVDPNEVSMDELGHLIFGAIERDGGQDVPKDRIIGLILQHCNRDVYPVIQTHGGITRVLDNVCQRGRERLEFYTDDDGQDFVALRQPYKQDAIENFGTKDVKGYRPDDLDDDDDDVESFISARSTTKPTSTVNSRAPVRSEIDVANDIWKIVRTRGQYRNRTGEYELRLGELETYRGMTEANVYRFVSRPEFEKYFRVNMQEGPDGSIMKYLFAVGREGPLKGILGIESSEDSVQRTIRQDTAPSSSGHGSAGRQDPSLPYPHKFYHKRNDPVLGYESHRNYKRREEVILTYFYDFYEFYVMTERDYDNAQKEWNKLFDDHCMLPFKDTQYWKKGYVGVYLMAKDKKAFRFTVLNVDEDDQEMKIQLVDFGDKQTIDVRDAVALREEYKKVEAKCFQCSLEDYDPIDEDELWAMRSTMMKYKNIPVIIEPIEKRGAPENILVVSLTFTPQEDRFSTERRFPDYLYSRKYTVRR